MRPPQPPPPGLPAAPRRDDGRDHGGRVGAHDRAAGDARARHVLLRRHAAHGVGACNDDKVHAIDLPTGTVHFTIGAFGGASGAFHRPAGIAFSTTRCSSATSTTTACRSSARGAPLPSEVGAPGWASGRGHREFNLPWASGRRRPALHHRMRQPPHPGDHPRRRRRPHRSPSRAPSSSEASPSTPRRASTSPTRKGRSMCSTAASEAHRRTRSRAAARRWRAPPTQWLRNERAWATEVEPD